MEERQNGAHIKVRMHKLLPVSLSCSSKIQMPVVKPVLLVFGIFCRGFLIFTTTAKTF